MTLVLASTDDVDALADELARRRPFGVDTDDGWWADPWHGAVRRTVVGATAQHGDLQLDVPKRRVELLRNDAHGRVETRPSDVLGFDATPDGRFTAATGDDVIDWPALA